MTARTLGSLMIAVAACCGHPATPTPPHPGTDAAAPLPSAAALEQIVLTSAGACGITADGDALCWGAWGGDLIPVSAAIAGIEHVVEVGIGHEFMADPQRYFEHMCARDRAGAVRCWGNDQQGQLGVDVADATEGTSTPEVVAGLGTVRELALGSRHTCALDEAGGVACWGDNAYGQAGAGEGTARVDRPHAVLGMGPIAHLVAAHEATCALGRDGRVWCWGQNRNAQCGITDVRHPVVWAPHEIELARGARQLAAGAGTFCAIGGDGRITCWGFLHELLGEAFVDKGVGQVPDIDDAAEVALGDSHGCALRASGEVWCWGAGTLGQLGDGTTPAASSPPVHVALAGRAARVVASGDDTCVRLEDHRWQCWGANLHGEIGPRAQTRIATPVLLDLAAVHVVSR